MTAKSEKYSKRHKVKYEESELSAQSEIDSEISSTKKSKRKSRQRQENSLGELTKNFINYMKKQEGREINLNDVVRQLKVKKRRIYDITNVLEGNINLILGIGYIKKLAKNKIQWRNVDESMEDRCLQFSRSSSESEEDYGEYETLLLDAEKLKNEEENLETMVDSIKNSFEKLTDDKSFNEYGYVTFEDIKALTAGEDKNLIAIKAPAGTSLEIPDPEQIHNLYLEYLQVYLFLIYRKKKIKRMWINLY